MSLPGPVLRLALLLAAAGCTAGAATGPSPGAPPPPLPEARVPSCGGRPLTLGPAALRRLSREEYRNSIADLFGLPAPAAADLPEDGGEEGLVSTSGQHLTSGQALKYVEVAAEIGSALVRNLPRHFPCATDALPESACVRRFLETSGTRIFRRRLTPDEVTRLHGTFLRARTTGRSFDESAAAMVQAMLVAPQFLFLFEGAARRGPGAQPLDSWQVATRLSYTLWKTTPDALLLEAAAMDRLRTPAALASHARRLLDSDRAKPAIAGLFEGWLALGDIERLEKDEAKYPGVGRDVIHTLGLETRRYVHETFWTGGALSELLVSKLRFRNHKLAKFYGDGLGKGHEKDQPRPYEAEPTEWSFGLLSQAGLLMAMGPSEEAAIIYRGKFLRRRLLCGQVEPPPPGVPPLPKLTPAMTSRQRVEAHTGGPSCFGCHSDLNPLGFALEHFDGVGRWRDEEKGQPIDSTAEIDDADLSGPVEGALDLSRKLGASRAVQRCVVQQLFTFAFARAPGPADTCVIDALEDRLRSSGGKLKELLVEVVTSPAMLAVARP